MNELSEVYILERFYRTVKVCRNAQSDFRRAPGDLKTDAVKKAHYEEMKLREQDLGVFMKKLADLYPNLKKILLEP
jgi:hypothetical protein